MYENNWSLSRSPGRILDIFYSKNWQQLLSDKKHLDCYLKKSYLFDNLGIIGICNSYLIKFRGAPQPVLEMLKNYKSADEAITRQAKAAIALQDKVFTEDPRGEMETTTYHVEGFDQKLAALLANYKATEDEEDALVKLLSEISYSQIGTALKQLEKVQFEKPDRIYSFLDSDFGFFLMGYAGGYTYKDEFLQLYETLAEFDVYSHYLTHAGIAHKKPDGTLDYNTIYRHLKYDEAYAFVGGGNNIRDNGVYAQLKLLEITFNTTLGFSNKQCSSHNSYSCDSDKRVKAWMQYLEQHNLVDKDTEPLSFHHFDYSFGH